MSTPRKPRKPRATPFEMCQFGTLPDGREVYCVRSRHTTSRAALNAAAIRSAFAPGRYRVRDSRTGQWLGEISSD